jgi:hypothetical protein
MIKMIKKLWNAYNSPVTAERVSEEQRELKHKARNTAAKVDLILLSLIRGMREEKDYQNHNNHHNHGNSS